MVNTIDIESPNTTITETPNIETQDNENPVDMYCCCAKICAAIVYIFFFIVILLELIDKEN
jgi:hypothetical protein